YGVEYVLGCLNEELHRRWRHVNHFAASPAHLTIALEDKPVRSHRHFLDAVLLMRSHVAAKVKNTDLSEQRVRPRNGCAEFEFESVKKRHRSFRRDPKPKLKTPDICVDAV
ncbi:MAG: hypothetical protein MHM6MM_006437, partial [Cercozoa sp. M6MM]